MCCVIHQHRNYFSLSVNQMLKMGVLGKLPLICIHEISLHIISGLSRFLIKDV